MPQVTVYVRVEDIDKWKSVQKKSEFIHDALNGVLPFSSMAVPIDEVNKINSFDIPGVQKGINEGLPCCKKTSPCRHWSYNDLEGLWVNSLTGETKEG